MPIQIATASLSPPLMPTVIPSLLTTTYFSISFSSSFAHAFRFDFSFPYSFLFSLYVTSAIVATSVLSVPSHIPSDSMFPFALPSYIPALGLQGGVIYPLHRLGMNVVSSNCSRERICVGVHSAVRSLIRLDVFLILDHSSF